MEFPGLEDPDISMTLALNHLKITSPRSVKRRANHFYVPYSSSKRRCNSDSATIRAVPISQAETVPLKLSLSLRSSSRTSEFNPTDQPNVTKTPWGRLTSLTGKPNIDLVNTTTGLGDISETVDIVTGERELHYSTLSASC